MQQIEVNYRGIGLLMDVNRDRLVYLATIVVALLAGAFLGSL